MGPSGMKVQKKSVGDRRIKKDRKKFDAQRKNQKQERVFLLD